MCCFSQRVTHVSRTRIFARGTEGGGQVLAYAMSVHTTSELSMVLPLPVPPRSSDDAIRFVDLSGYKTLFPDLQRAFPAPAGAPQARSKGPITKALTVQVVGAFEASFVPSPADFARLDPRFRLPDDVLDSLPQYADWGFAVFKLRFDVGTVDYHPMAFEFPRRDPAQLFFPTVHVHDGAVPEQASFDHVLYWQSPGIRTGFFASPEAVQRSVDIPRTQGIVSPDLPLASRSMFGPLPNRDTFIDD